MKKYLCTKFSSNGLSLLELLITIAFMSVLLSMAIPSMWYIIKDKKIDDAAMSITYLIGTSKKASIAKLQPVFVCPTENGRNCGEGWENGFMSFYDYDDNQEFDNDDELIFSEIIDSTSISISTSNELEDGFSFNNEGVLEFSTTQMFVVCDDRGFNEKSKNVIVTFTGYSSVYLAENTDVTSCEI